MDDNKSNKIMEEYVNSTSSGMDIDFKKLSDKPKKKKFLFNRIFFTTSIAVFALLLIILPIHFLKREEPADETRYYDSNSVSQQAIESISQLEELDIKGYLTPKIQVEPSIRVYSLIDNLNVVLGAKFQYSVRDYNFKVVNIGIIKKENKLKEFELYDNFLNNINWKNLNVKYCINYKNMEDIYNIQIKFSDDKYDYFIETVTYEQLEIPFILDYIY